MKKKSFLQAGKKDCLVRQVCLIDEFNSIYPDQYKLKKIKFSGNHYYLNIYTKESQWECPTEPAEDSTQSVSFVFIFFVGPPFQIFFFLRAKFKLLIC